MIHHYLFLYITNVMFKEQFDGFCQVRRCG